MTGTAVRVASTSSKAAISEAAPRRWPGVLVGSVAFCLGLITTLGWILRLPAVVQLRPEWGGMVLTTSLCVMMAGIGVLASLWDTRLARSVRASMGMGIFLIAALTLAEGLAGRNLGIDTPALHAALLPDYPAPGRMAPNTTFNFFLLGAAFVLSVRTRKRFLFRIVLGMVFLVGLIGLLGYCLNLQYFYGWYTNSGLVRMSLPTSLMMMLLPFGMWSMPGRAAVVQAAEDKKGQELQDIFRASAVVLLVTAIMTAIASFAFMQHRIFRLTSDKLSQLAHNDGVLIEQEMASRSERATFAASVPSLPQSMRRWNAGDATGAVALDKLGADLVAHGFSGVVFQGAGGRTLQAGSVVADPGIRIALHDAGSGELIWSNAYYLETRIPVRDDAGVYGEMVGYQPIPMIDRLVSESMASGKTSSLGLCTKEASLLRCFPQRYRPAPFVVSVADPAADAGPKQAPPPVPRSVLPMSRALAGQTGTDITLDYRRVPVMASYTPIQGAPLGLVLKMDTTEIYEPVRHGVEITIPLIGLLILLSLKVMQWRLRPLVGSVVRSREQIRQLALHDSLTGLPNRILLQDRLEMALSSARRNGTCFALALMDVDGFKQVNDTFGHATGDLLLQTIADRLKGCLRASDTVARLGGDEFVLLLAGVSCDEAVREIAKKISHAFAASADLGPCKHFIHLSVGVTRYPAGGEDAASLLHNADVAMYSAKQSGGNRCEIFREPLSELRPEVAELEVISSIA